MQDGTFVIALFNTAENAAPVTVNFSDCGFEGQGIVRDVWANASLGLVTASFTTPILNPHASQLIRITPLNSALIQTQMETEIIGMNLLANSHQSETTHWFER